MKTSLYSVKDVLAGVFGPVFQTRNDNIAYRSYKDFIDKNSLDYHEYELYHICFWDDETGKVTDEFFKFDPDDRPRLPDYLEVQ